MDAMTILPRFVVLEGLDGSGTTTQLELLRRRFDSSGLSGWFTCEPSDGFIGRSIRRVLGKEVTLDPRSLALLFAADRNEHLYGQGGIVEHLDRVDYVVSDRYLFSSLAYQSQFSGFEYVSRINEPFPLPEFLIFLDLDPEICQERMNGRKSRDIFEEIEEQKGFLAWYKRGIDVFKDSGMKIAFLDASESPEGIAEKIWSFIDPESIKGM
jgi:dTMP kinase